MKRVYDVALSLWAGYSIGWFGWWYLGSYGSADSPPLWAFVIPTTVGVFFAIRWLRGRSPSGQSGWVHLLWIPVAVFVALMAAVVIALRNWQ